MADPLSAAAAALVAQSVLDFEMHMICDIVAEHVRAQTPVTGNLHFWHVIAKALEDRHGITRSAISIRKEYEKVRAWAIANRTGSDGDERKFIKKSLRRAKRQQAVAARDGGVVGEEGDGDEEENGEGGDVPSAFDNMGESLALPPAGPAQQQQQQQQPPSGGNPTFSLPVRPKEG